MGIYFLAVYHRKIGVLEYHGKVKDLKMGDYGYERSTF